MAHLPQVAAVFCWTGCVNTLTHAARLLVLMLLLLLLCENERKTNEPRRDDDTSFHFCVSQSSFPFMGEGHIIRFALSRSRQSSFAIVMLRCQARMCHFFWLCEQGRKGQSTKKDMFVSKRGQCLLVQRLRTRKKL